MYPHTSPAHTYRYPAISTKCITSYIYPYRLTDRQTERQTERNTHNGWWLLFSLFNSSACRNNCYKVLVSSFLYLCQTRVCFCPCLAPLTVHIFRCLVFLGWMVNIMKWVLKGLRLCSFEDSANANIINPLLCHHICCSGSVVSRKSHVTKT